MKIKSLSKTFLSTILLFTGLSLISCGKNSSASSKKSDKPFRENMELSVSATNEDFETEKTRLHIDSYNGKTIIVFFGYGYNQPEFYKSTIELLEKEFGLKENGGLVEPVLYPSDLRNRIMNLYDTAANLDLNGIILLGAPERTHFAIAKLQDDWESNEPYSVFSFFPQDDILGQESTCSFVVEYEHSTAEETEKTEIEQELDEEFKHIIVNAINYMAELPGPVSKDSNLAFHVQKIFGEKKIHHYVDEFGIKSLNHFIVEKDK